MTEVVVVLIPVLNRPGNVAPLIESLTATAPTARPLFICDTDDTAEHAAIDTFGVDRMICGGTYAEKINAGYRATAEPYMLLAADDLRFHPGWLDAALGRVDDTAGVIGTNDLGSARVVRGEHATHSLVARCYVDRYGTIDGDGVLHDGYRHNFVDDELVATAKHRGAWRFADDSHVEHLHPLWGKADSDHVYDHGQSSFGRDRDLFRSRCHLWT